MFCGVQKPSELWCWPINKLSPPQACLQCEEKQNKKHLTHSGVMVKQTLWSFWTPWVIWHSQLINKQKTNFLDVDIASDWISLQLFRAVHWRLSQLTQSCRGWRSFEREYVCWVQGCIHWCPSSFTKVSCECSGTLSLLLVWQLWDAFPTDEWSGVIIKCYIWLGLDTYRQRVREAVNWSKMKHTGMN